MKKITIIGLGYVGLPLAVEFAKKYPVVGFDINRSRVDELKKGHDSTLEVADENLQSVLSEKQPGKRGCISQRLSMILRIQIFISSRYLRRLINTNGPTSRPF